MIWSKANCPSTQTDVESIRSRFYGFVQFAPDNDVAVDISFGSVGFTLALARAFRTVSHPNAHSHHLTIKVSCFESYVSYGRRSLSVGFLDIPTEA